MKKIVRLTESDLYNIIQRVNENLNDSNSKKLIDELTNILYNLRSNLTQDSKYKILFDNKNELNTLSVAISNWVYENPNYNQNLLKASISILFRESTASFVSFVKPKEILGFIGNIFGGDFSQGYAQIKPSTAQKYGIKMEDLNSFYGSLSAVYKMLEVNYEKAKKYYSGPTVTIFNDKRELIKIPAIGNDAALHMAVAAHNAGDGILGNWCRTSCFGIANKCEQGSRTFKEGRCEIAVTYKNQKIENYFPKVGTVHNYLPQFKILLSALNTVPTKADQISQSYRSQNKVLAKK